MLRLLIADDHGLYRRGLRLVLEKGIPGCSYSEAESLEGALSILTSSIPVDLAILDLWMPGMRSLVELREIPRMFPRTRFAILSAQETSEAVLGTLAAGLHGYISKSQPNGEVVTAIADVLSGRIYVPPWLAQPSASGVGDDGAGQAASSPQAARLARLTLRQRDVLVLIANGLSN